MPSSAFEPSVTCAKNRLKSSKPPTPRFLFIGDSIITTNEYIAITRINDAIIILINNATMLKYPILVVILVNETITITILNIKAGCVAAAGSDLKKFILDVPHSTSILNANIITHP